MNNQLMMTIEKVLNKATLMPPDNMCIPRALFEQLKVQYEDYSFNQNMIPKTDFGDSD